MSEQSFYRPCRSELCQGDIFACVPQVHLRSEPRLLRRTTLSGSRDGFEVAEQVSTYSEVSQRTGVTVPADCDVTMALLLTHDCEIDKDKHRTVALIRPLDPRMPEPDLDIIRRNKRFPFFYLPTDPLFPTLPDSYVDLRRISTLAIGITDSAQRIACLEDMSRSALLLQLFRFYTRIELKRELLLSK